MTKRSTTPGKRPASPLRAALAAITSLRTYHDIAIAPAEQVEAAQRRVDVARQLQAATLLQEDPEVRERAQRLLDEALAARGECFHRIWFRGLGHTEFDALVALHPPTDEQDGASWNSETFIPGLLAACVVDGDLTAEEWAAELADETRWSASERRAVISMALAAQRQTMADAVPKD